MMTISNNCVRICKLAYYIKINSLKVSFQDKDDLQNVTATAPPVMPILLRRASIVPFASRIRANRPPTAPPSSVFLRDHENGLV